MLDFVVGVMQMLNFLSFAVLILAAVYLIALGVASLFFTDRAKAFLLAFAGTAKLHYLELTLRIIAGLAFLQYSPKARFPAAFMIFGGLLVATTAVLLVLPWSWHKRFADATVPMFVGYLKLIGIVSVILGLAILWNMSRSI